MFIVVTIDDTCTFFTIVFPRIFIRRFEKNDTEYWAMNKGRLIDIFVTLICFFIVKHVDELTS